MGDAAFATNLTCRYQDGMSDINSTVKMTKTWECRGVFEDTNQESTQDKTSLKVYFDRESDTYMPPQVSGPWRFCHGSWLSSPAAGKISGTTLLLGGIELC